MAFSRSMIDLLLSEVGVNPSGLELYSFSCGQLTYGNEPVALGDKLGEEVLAGLDGGHVAVVHKDNASVLDLGHDSLYYLVPVLQLPVK